MKNKNICFAILGAVLIIFLGIGIGYVVYKNNGNISDNKIQVDIEHAKLYSDDYVESCVSVKINGKNISDEINVGYMDICSYKIFNNLVLLETYNDVSGYSFLYIYNTSGKKLFDMGDVPTDLLTFWWELDKENSKVNFYSKLTEETGGVSDRVYKITGKDLYELTCEELDYYKDKIVAMETYELILKDNNISNIKLVNEEYLENYITNNYNHYNEYLEICSNN